jgi:hypothetical protein
MMSFINFTLQLLLTFAFSNDQGGILFFSRPIANIQLDVLSKLSKRPTTSHIELKGISLDAMQELILNKFAFNGVSSVAPNVVKGNHKIAYFPSNLFSVNVL